MEKIHSQAIGHILKLHWKKLLVVCVGCVIVSLTLSSSLFIKPIYKSVAVIYPANLIAFSTESNTEQLLQFLNSTGVKARLIKRFDLFHHYGIDPNDPKAAHKLNTTYNAYIKLNKTIYESLDIEVLDESPAFAQKLANGLIEETNTFIREAKREKTKEYITTYNAEFTIKYAEIDSIEAKLKYMRISYGLLDVNTQTKMISKRQGKTLSPEDQLLLKGLKEFGGEYTILQNRLKIELNSLKKLKLDYDRQVTDYNSHLNYMTIISQASFPDKKHSPHQFIIISLFTISSLFIAVLVLLLRTRKEFSGNV